MVDYTEEDLGRASRIVDSLFEGERQIDGIEHGASIIDVEVNTRQFVAELDVLADFDLRFPAVKLGDGELVPVSLGAITPPLVGGIWTRGLLPKMHRSPYWDEYFDYARRGLEQALKEVPTLPIETARKTFMTRARKFLATRYAGVRAQRSKDSRFTPLSNLNMAQYIGGPPVAMPGCHFYVHTNSPGLTAYWSGAYYISSNYLGAPTTPAVGVLQAGTYVFGVAGGAYRNTLQWDMNAVCTLPGTSSVHLNY